MLRLAHRWPGLLAAALVIVLSLSGAALSFFPAAESLSAPAQTETNLTVGTLAERVQATYPDVEQIRRAPSGKITAYWFDNGAPQAATVDPATGKGIASADSSGVERWLKNLHRSLFLGDGGRIAMATGALAMLVLSVSGLFLVARRTGGWRRFFAPLKGSSAGRIHVEIARFTFLGLLLSSVTAIWMTASTFGFLPEGSEGPAFPATVSEQTGYPLSDILRLRETPVSDLRELNFPSKGDKTDVYTLQTSEGTGYIDQGNGALISWVNATVWDKINATIMMLHTGQGASLLGLALGLMALGVPAMAVTGTLQWWKTRRSRPRIRGNAHPGRADTIVLVGSEGGSTWGFAATLYEALKAAGRHAHVAPMSAFDPTRYSQAKEIVVMAATYGDGDAPSSAKGFLEKLHSLPEVPKAKLAVLGFGDRSFPAFCGYATEVVSKADERAWPQLLPLDTVDRQSPQDFARWGKALGETLGIELELHHNPVLPQVCELKLVSRRDYGASVQTPSAILRFRLPQASLWQKLTGRAPRFAAGDLMGIVPEGSQVPRFYSLASARKDGFAEICVRKHPGGLCSTQLLDMKPGDAIHVFFRRNAGFRPLAGRKPVILIGAGTGIGPLAGFIRANAKRQPMHLFFGARHPTSDVFYAPELAEWQVDGRLSSLTTAYSRTADRAYVQDALRRDGKRVAQLIASGAQIMVCGGSEMAAGVSAALADILAPLNLTTARLKVEGRYAEDIY